MIALIGVVYGVMGFTWINMIVGPGDILDQLPVVFNKVIRNEKILHVLFGCEKCFAGQLSLWTYYLVAVPYTDLTYDMVDHLLVVVFSIFSAGFINRLYMHL